jgi:hypothetical protein
MTIDDLFELFVEHLVNITLLASSSPDPWDFLMTYGMTTRLSLVRNDDEIEFGASWWGGVEQVSASYGDDEVTSKGGRVQQLDDKREHVWNPMDEERVRRSDNEQARER